ncbi:MAG TPA: SemiSWEET family transporter [Patescibacteria group bacterium]|jgi:MtN3 and saliva related transmembrane protein|nr:SemiSWEET family transporter [Patescibacteria group bacterium]
MKLNQPYFDYYKKYMLFIGAIGHSVFVLQTYKIFLTKSSHDVSLEGFLIYTLSVASWLLYGYLVRDKILIRVNLFGFVAAIVCIASIIVYK